MFIGGGAKLLREYLENTDKIGKCVFVEDICANAKDMRFCTRCRKEWQVIAMAKEKKIRM